MILNAEKVRAAAESHAPDARLVEGRAGTGVGSP